MRGSGTGPAGTATVLAALGLAVAGLAGLAGCSHALPLGPSPGPSAAPAPVHLGSAIVLEPVVGQHSSSAGKCPAGTFTLAGPGIAPQSAGATPGLCYRRLGTPLRVTTAAVGLSHMQQQNGQSQYQLLITVPEAQAQALTAVTTTAYDSSTRQLAIIVAGQTWGIPVTLQPLTTGVFAIATPTETQAVRLEHILLK